MAAVANLGIEGGCLSVPFLKGPLWTIQFNGPLETRGQVKTVEVKSRKCGFIEKSWFKRRNEMMKKEEKARETGGIKWGKP